MAKSKKTKRGVMMMTDDEMDMGDMPMKTGKKKKGQKKG